MWIIYPKVITKKFGNKGNSKFYSIWRKKYGKIILFKVTHLNDLNFLLNITPAILDFINIHASEY